tara:strand:- start:3774 stop:4139 length:366 start_codon:yes stop_codon:yes gene_type:complete
MNKEKIQNWFFEFFEFSTKDRSTVTSVSCKFFGEYVFNKQQERILELEKENLILKAHYCLDALSVNINKLMLDKLQAKRDLEQQAKGIEGLKFPTMLRKMWSGGDVQKWILQQAKAKGGDL